MTRVMQILPGLACGAIFGLGLSLSGMLDPTRMRGFLAVSGAWDSSLAFVMGGAVMFAFVGMAVRRRLRQPAFNDSFHLPAKTPINTA